MSAQTSFSTRLRNGGAFSEQERVSIVERAKRRAHNALLGLFEKKLSSEAISVVERARRISRDPSRVSRTLNYSSNSTIETLALLAASMGKDIQIDFPDFASTRNYNGLSASISQSSLRNNFEIKKTSGAATWTSTPKLIPKKYEFRQNRVWMGEDA